ncbi:unnamed protein product [Scytosiphon promiscuus]
MSARQLNRLAKAKGGLDPLLGGALNEESDESEELGDSEEEARTFSTGAAVSVLAFGDDSSDESSSSSSSEDEGSSDADSSEGERSNDDGANGTPAPIVGASGIDESVGPTAVDDYNPDAAQNSALQSGTTGSSSRKTKSFASTNSSVDPTPKGSKKKKATGQENEKNGDDEYLDSVISELALKAAAAKAAGEGASAEELQNGPSSPLALLLRCDPRCLKLDQELRRKFGGGDRENGAAAGARGGRARRTRRGMMLARGGNNSVSASLTLKRLVVSSPKEDWPKPPSFVGGGLGMKKCEGGAPSYLPPWQADAHRGAEWFVFERSGSLEQLHRKFEAIQSMHDPNLLASFASRAPYHADALLQLGMVFAHTGQMDRASEFVGRCLYVLESAATESFRPMEGACRLDATLDVNKTYFAAMFRHMQMSGMVGGSRTALEVGRLLLSLDPIGDPMGCLLALDSHALASRQGEFLLDLHGSKLAIGRSPTDAARAFASSATRQGRGGAIPPHVTVQDLPGLSMSVCLAMLDTTGDAIAAREAMASALLRFPIVLEPLLEKCGVSPRSTTYPHDWKSVMQHPHFGGAKDRLKTGHVLWHLVTIFAQRGGELWKHERAEELLYDGAGIALQGLPTSPMGALAGTGAAAAEAIPPAAEDTAATAAVVAGARLSSPPAPSTSFCPSASEAEVLRRAYGEESPINKYLDLALSDFDESFALLPQDANILDPRLMGPNFMNERVRLRMPAGAGPGHEGGRGWRGGHDVLDEVLAMAMQVIGRQDEAARVRRRGGRGGRGGAGGNLSPESPLAQLFWQTFLPWNVFPTPSRPPPPPPRWL